MSRFQFELATLDDDQQLRWLLQQTPMPGRISLSLEREPSFFAAMAVEGEDYQVIVCRDRVHGQIVGFGTRSVRWRYVNGQPCRVGYLGSLRLLREYRSARLVARGYQFFKELAQQDPVDWHFTSIADDNLAAVRLLTSGRARLPIYRRVATLKTLVLTSQAHKQLSAQTTTDSTPIEVRNATQADVPALVEQLNACNVLSNFSLHLRAEDFQVDTTTNAHVLLRDLPLDKIRTAWFQGKLIGSLGTWDQSRFKQIVVRSMPASWQWMRPLWNGLRVWHHQPPLQRVGEKLPSRLAALFSVGEPQQSNVLALLKRTLQHLQPDDYFLLAVDVRDALYEWLKRLAYMTYQTGIYLVGWDVDQIANFNTARPVALELGCL